MKNPPPLVPSSLIASCDATGPCGIFCVLPSRVLIAVSNGSSGRRPARRGTARRRMRSAEGARASQRVRSTQKLPSVFAECARDAADDGDRQHDADGRGDEVVERQAEHLGEVRHRRLAAVGLPVRVRGEGHRRVPGETGSDRRHLVGIQRQEMLQPLDGVREEERDGVEHQHGDRVGGPALLLRLVDAAKAIDRALDGVRLLAGKEARHVDAERLRDGQDEREVDEDLQRQHHRSSGRSSANSR